MVVLQSSCPDSLCETVKSRPPTVQCTTTQSRFRCNFVSAAILWKTVMSAQQNVFLPKKSTCCSQAKKVCTIRTCQMQIASKTLLFILGWDACKERIFAVFCQTCTQHISYIGEVPSINHFQFWRPSSRKDFLAVLRLRQSKCLKSFENCVERKP